MGIAETISKKMNEEPISIERTFNAPVEIIWKAISERNEMEKWYFNLKEFKAEVGFEFRFWGGDEKKQWLHLCKVTEVESGKKLAYSWRYDGYEGNSLAAFELFPEGNKTMLKLTHERLETFPPVPEFRKENLVAGWTDITGTSLKEYLEKINSDSKQKQII